LSFYNGGTGGNGSGPGPNLGATFSPNALALIDSDAGGTGNFGGEPSPDAILFFREGETATMDVPAGFETEFSFFYSAIYSAASITIYDGPGATGNTLAVLVLPVTPSDGGDPTGDFSPLFPIGVEFEGIARSVDFTGTANQVGFDNITFGSGILPTPTPTATPTPTPTPEPGVILQLVVGVAGLAFLNKRRMRRGAVTRTETVS
jgi:hypothetical protein